MTGDRLTAEDVRDFFAEVLARDPDALQRIERAGPDLELGRTGFVFTLPALHTLLDPSQNLPYRTFRKMLYESSLNQELIAFDAEVVAHRSTGKTDTSRYCLRRRPGS